jgi:hypothetical protein
MTETLEKITENYIMPGISGENTTFPTLYERFGETIPIYASWGNSDFDIQQSDNGAIKINYGIPELEKPIHDTFNINNYGDISNGHTTYGNNPDTKIRIDHGMNIPTGLGNPYNGNKNPFEGF